MRRGDIHWVDFGVPKGSEQGGRRPALIIQNDVGNRSSITTIIAAITSTLYDVEYPFHVRISAIESGLKKDSTVKLEQIRTISNERLIGFIGHLSKEKMKEIDEAMRVSLGLILMEESNTEDGN